MSKSKWNIQRLTGLVSIIAFAISIIKDISKKDPWFTTLIDFFTKIYHFSISVMVLELKLWWVLLFCASILLFYKIVLVRLKTISSKGFLSYDRDSIDGVAWRWHWNKNTDGKYSISDLQAYCPQCDTPLMRDGAAYGDGYLSCPRCGFSNQKDLMYGCEIDRIEVLIHDNARKKEERHWKSFQND